MERIWIIFCVGAWLSAIYRWNLSKVFPRPLNPQLTAKKFSSLWQSEKATSFPYTYSIGSKVLFSNHSPYFLPWIKKLFPTFFLKWNLILFSFLASRCIKSHFVTCLTLWRLSEKPSCQISEEPLVKKSVFFKNVTPFFYFRLKYGGLKKSFPSIRDVFGKFREGFWQKILIFLICHALKRGKLKKFVALPLTHWSLLVVFSSVPWWQFPVWPIFTLKDLATLSSFHDPEVAAHLAKRKEKCVTRK